MPTLTATLDLSTTVSQVPYQRSADTRVNIKKRREQIRFQTRTNRDQVNVAYIQAPPVTPSANLHIADRSKSIPANRPLSSDIVTTFTASTTISTTRDILITDEFTTGSGTVTAEPLFFVHDMDSSNFPNGASDTIIAITLLDRNFNEVRVRDSKFDTTNRKVFSNIEHSFDVITGVATVFYVKYTVKLSSPAGSVATYIEILNSQPVFNEATFTDLDEFGLLITASKAYLIAESAGEFDITLPISDTYSIKQIVDSKIFLTPPPVLNIDSQWFVSVKNGDFLTTRTTGDPATSANYQYRVAEFAAQGFNPVFPTKKVTAGDAVIIDSHLIRLSKFPVVVDDDTDIHAQLLIRDSNENLKLALSTDTADNNVKAGEDIDGNNIFYIGGVGRDEDGNRFESQGIRSIDNRAGFFDILNLLDTDDEVVATYFYDETQLELTTLEFNPVFNRDILSETVSLYVKPETTSSLTKTVFFLVTDEDGRVISSDDTTSVITGSGIQDLIDGGFLYYETVPPAGVVPAPPAGSVSS